MARAGPWVAGLALEDGTRKWRRPVAASVGTGRHVVRVGSGVVVDATAAGRTVLEAVDMDGGERWQHTVLGSPVRALAGDDGAWWLVTRDPGRCWAVEVGWDGAKREIALPDGATNLARVGDALWVGVRQARGHAQGLYVVESGSVVAERRDSIGVQTLVQGPDRVLVVRDPGGSDGYTVQCHHRSNGSLAWAAEGLQSLLDADSMSVAALDATVAGGSMVLLDQATGARRWEGPAPFMEEAFELVLAGDCVLMNHMMGLMVADRCSGEVLQEASGSEGAFQHVGSAGLADGALVMADGPMVIALWGGSVTP